MKIADIFVGDHRQPLPEREDLQVEDGPASEQAGQGGAQGEEASRIVGLMLSRR